MSSIDARLAALRASGRSNNVPWFQWREWEMSAWGVFFHLHARDGSELVVDSDGWRDRQRGVRLANIILPPFVISIPDSAQSKARAVADSLAMYGTSELYGLRAMLALRIPDAIPRSPSMPIDRPIDVPWEDLRNAASLPWRVAGEPSYGETSMIFIPSFDVITPPPARLDDASALAILAALTDEGLVNFASDKDGLQSLIDSDPPRLIQTPFGWVLPMRSPEHRAAPSSDSAPVKRTRPAKR